MAEKEGADPGTFADALADLKRQGSMLLVAGTASTAAQSACGYLLGDPSADPRRRLYVEVGTGSRIARPDPGVPSRRVRYPVAARSAVAAGSGTTSRPDRVVDGDLADLQAAVEDAVDALGGDGLGPAELRVCLDAADGLLATHGEEATFAFLHALRGLVRGVDGMGHVHLPVPYEDEAVAVLTPVFDAVIEVRQDGGEPKQRWHVRDADFTTDWLSL